ncbi:MULTISPECIES: flagellar export chaperone FliS [Methyloversatilis]|uniref:flagellar export chaperone FliS n=1 Tax=Methyloversatilis TaxID=378210 RepID=UPI0019B66C59|nr:flagellar export chaperone FliS [Methyloversatilis sp.]MBL8468806.1 flagellar export chaperone FliS [Methyloversatilis discipulorum]MBT9516511.1 flagellar export chaperone FliS [Methyloversatilis discipulorum]
MAYNQVGVEARVASADPHQLILMLFDGAMMSVSTASHQIDMGDTAGKGQSISRAIDIIGNGLKVSLDLEAGGELAQRLYALYDYMCVRLLHANSQNDKAALDEVAHLLGELKGAWEDIRQKLVQGAPV